MSGEKPAVDPALADINRIFEVGLPAFTQGINPDDLQYRARRAYDSAWENLYREAFPDEEAGLTTEPTQKIIEAFDRIFDQTKDLQFFTYAIFASMGNWLRGEDNEIEVLFGGGAQYLYETKFSDYLTELCIEGGVTGGGTYEHPRLAADVLRHYMTTMLLTWGIQGREAVSPDEAKLGVRTIVFGPGPTLES